MVVSFRPVAPTNSRPVVNSVQGGVNAGGCRYRPPATSIHPTRGFQLMGLCISVCVASCYAAIVLVSTFFSPRIAYNNLHTLAVDFDRQVEGGKNYFLDHSKQYPAVLLQGTKTSSSSISVDRHNDENTVVELIPTDGVYTFEGKQKNQRSLYKMRGGKKRKASSSDEYEYWNGEVGLQFRKIPEGWQIYGHGKANMSPFRIEEGNVAHDGSGWWRTVDDGSPSDNEEAAVIYGKFDFEKNDFQGSWRRNSRTGPYCGIFDTFHLLEKFASDNDGILGLSPREVSIDAASGSLADSRIMVRD
jgi:hypothetical protein